VYNSACVYKKEKKKKRERERERKESEGVLMHVKGWDAAPYLALHCGLFPQGCRQLL